MDERADFSLPGAVFERAAEVFALLGTPMRLRIMSQLCGREMNVAMKSTGALAYTTLDESIPRLDVQFLGS